MKTFIKEKAHLIRKQGWKRFKYYNRSFMMGWFVGFQMGILVMAILYAGFVAFTTLIGN